MDWLGAAIITAAVVAWLGWKQLTLVRSGIACELLRQGARIIDVRSVSEYQTRHLAPAINIPLDELRERIAREVPSPDTILLLHCVAGVRSRMAQRRLQAMGYHQVHNLGSYRRAERIFQRSQR